MQINTQNDKKRAAKKRKTTATPTGIRTKEDTKSERTCNRSLINKVTI